MEQPVMLLCSRTVKGTVVCFGTSLNQQFEQNAVVLLPYGASLLHNNVRPHTAIHSVKQDTGFKIGGLIPSSICPRFVTHRFSPHLAPKRRHVRPRPIRWGEGLIA